MKKTAFLLVFLLAMGILDSCDMNCPSLKTHAYNWTGYNLSYLSYRVANGNLESAPAAATDFGNTGFALKLAFTYKLAANTGAGSGFLATATAKCIADEYYSVNDIELIEVRTLTAFDATHPKFSTVNDLFAVPVFVAGKISQLEKWLPVSSLTKDYYTDSTTSNSWLDRYSPSFYLLEKPAAGSTQQFEVLVHLEDGTVFRKETALLQF